MNEIAGNINEIALLLGSLMFIGGVLWKVWKAQQREAARAAAVTNADNL